MSYAGARKRLQGSSIRLHDAPIELHGSPTGLHDSPFELHHAPKQLLRASVGLLRSPIELRGTPGELHMAQTFLQYEPAILGVNQLSENRPHQRLFMTQYQMSLWSYVSQTFYLGNLRSYCVVRLYSVLVVCYILSPLPALRGLGKPSKRGSCN